MPSDHGAVVDRVVALVEQVIAETGAVDEEVAFLRRLGGELAGEYARALQLAIEAVREYDASGFRVPGDENRS
jgi:hypothetical protein